MKSCTRVPVVKDLPSCSRCGSVVYAFQSARFVFCPRCKTSFKVVPFKTPPVDLDDPKRTVIRRDDGILGYLR